ncbi:EamA-like transporter family protein [Kribbella amoyensis]|uniref:EamA-like transporter family protein n=1 Tax=Kribbella amoyensis TaxID=996641 RepID=A0A561BND6_9ACTN|nr:EamA family transporter [Kribbella amoyensis]TWD80354.1 EamA-like transporter family protein [Kribbella amoyensis]
MGVLLAVLGAAVLHSIWNAIAHGVPDRAAGFALLGISSGTVGAVAAVVTGLPPASTWPFIAASVLLHLTYYAGLLASYQLGQFSQVYPLARGTSPWVVAVVAVLVLGQQVAPVELGGILLISAGLIALVFIGGRPTRSQRPALLAACGTGLAIAAYTVVDGLAVHRMPVLQYMGWVFMIQGFSVPLLTWWWRGPGFLRQERGALIAGLGGGVVSMVAYGLVLWAQTRGALASIAALRETSIIFGAVIGRVFFGERFGPARAAAAGVVVAGIVLIAL